MRGSKRDSHKYRLGIVPDFRAAKKSNRGVGEYIGRIVFFIIPGLALKATIVIYSVVVVATVFQ